MKNQRKILKPKISYQAMEPRLLLACDLVGTGGDDNLAIRHITPELVRVTINGVEQDCTESVNLDAGAGRDRILIRTSSGDDQAELRPGSVQLQGNVNFNVTNIEFSSISSDGGYDSAQVFGTAADEVLILNDVSFLMKSANVHHQVGGFDQIFADAGLGRDTVFMVDSAVDDLLIAGGTNAYFKIGVNTTSMVGVEDIHATSRFGDDQAVFTGSAGNDSVYSNDEFTSMMTPNSFVRVTGFKRVVANDSGGNDIATFVDTAEIDEFWGTDSFASFKFGTNDSRVSLNQFKKVTVIPSVPVFSSTTAIPNDIVNGGAGNDRLLFESDRFSIDRFSILMDRDVSVGQWGSIFVTNARSFETIEVLPDEQDDTELATVFVFDSAGNDLAEGDADLATFTGGGITVNVREMSKIHGVARNGGVNTWAISDTITADVFRSGDWIDG